MFEWLGENWWALWLTVFLAFAVIEMITLDLFFIMLGGGALAGLVADFAGADLWLQIVVFCVVSLLMIAFVRPGGPHAPAQGPGRTAHQHGPADRRAGTGHGSSQLPPAAWSKSAATSGAPGPNRRPARRASRPWSAPSTAPRPSWPRSRNAARATTRTRRFLLQPSRRQQLPDLPSKLTIGEKEMYG